MHNVSQGAFESERYTINNNAHTQHKWDGLGQKDWNHLISQMPPCPWLTTGVHTQGDF